MNGAKLGDQYCFIGDQSLGTRLENRCGTVTAIEYKDRVQFTTIEIDKDLIFTVTNPTNWLEKKHYLLAKKILDPIRKHTPEIVRVILALTFLGLFYLSFGLIVIGTIMAIAFFLGVRFEIAILLSFIPMYGFMACMQKIGQRYQNIIFTIKYINSAIIR